MTRHELEIEDVRASIVSDDGQNVRSTMLKPCPFCGAHEGGGPYAYPFIQVGPEWSYGAVDARVVCNACHVATVHVTGHDGPGHSGREEAVLLAIGLWNRRAGDGE